MDSRNRTDKASQSHAQQFPRALNIVIADDERDAVLTLMAVLRDEGHRVRGVYNGRDVLAVVHAERPDAVIVDIDMPGHSGYEVARELRNLYEDRAPLLIAISGKWMGQTDKLLGQLVGFDHYCLKPCDPNELLKLLAPLTRSSGRSD